MTRTNSTTATIAVAADYADAMMTARRAKNWIFILLLLVLLLQIAIFFLVRFNVLKLEGDVTVTVPTGVDVTTQPADGAAATQPGVDASLETKTKRFGVEDVLRYVIPLTDFLGMTLTIVLCVVLLLIVMIMLVGRLIGVSHVTGAFIWCVVLAVLLFPWQALLIGGKRPPTDLPSPYLAAEDQHPEFKVPGALYTWPELKRDVRFSGGSIGVLKWARFVGFPAAALLLLLMVQAKSSRGLKFALGESEVQVEVTGTSV
jgi:hypothetical protein